MWTGPDETNGNKNDDDSVRNLQEEEQSPFERLLTKGRWPQVLCDMLTAGPHVYFHSIASCTISPKHKPKLHGAHYH